jgi:hypothetical protein
MAKAVEKRSVEMETRRAHGFSSKTLRTINAKTK